MGVRNRSGLLLLISFFCLILLPSVSAVEIAHPTDIKLEYFYPVLVAFAIAVPMWLWFIPNQLANLQVAFEIDDDLYEVHNISRGVKGAKRLIKSPGVAFGISLYMMGMTGVLMLISELLFDADLFYEPNLILMGLLIMVPVILSPWETINAQFGRGKSRSQVKSRVLRKSIRRFITAIILISATFATLYFGVKSEDGKLTPVWIAASMLVFMAPTIFAYGRIMGASWNMLLINKWRTANGRANPIDPVKPRFLNRLFSLVLVIFLLTMPLTALNGIVTVLYVLTKQPENATEILNFGGLIGYSLYLRIDVISELLFHWQFIKMMPQFLSFYLSINIAIVGLAFIFELARNLILGGQTFGGLFGVTLDTPREIRTEETAQGRQLNFAFAGFSGYTVLLLILVCYKEFGQMMPFTLNLESNGFDEGMRLLTTWMFIAVGQAVFMLTWMLSMVRFSHLKNLRFDLNPDVRREGAVRFRGGDWMRDLIDKAAIEEDLDTLIRFQRRSIDEDPALVRHEKARAKMWEMAIRGLWPSALEEARKVLAQSGGDDDEARMVIAVGHMASRRLDAAREALHGLQQPEGYDEPELLAFVCEWLDPWHGSVDDDDFWDWENNSTIDHVQMLMRMLRGWQAKPNVDLIHRDRLTNVGRLSMISLLRAQRRHDEALEMALELVRAEPCGVRPRIATALCLIDKGDWHSARSILTELRESDGTDPRVKALSTLMGQADDEDEFEVAVTLGDKKRIKELINEAPVNAAAGVAIRGGMDEAINANVLIAAHEAVRLGMPPRYSFGVLNKIIHYFLLSPIWILFGIYVSTLRGEAQAAAVVVTLFVLHFGARKFAKQQRRVVRHRDQKAMVAYARRMKRFKVTPEKGNLPIGTHLLLSGILVTVNGVVLDVGMPAWLTVRLPKDSEKTVKARLRRQANSMTKERPPRLQPLGEGWWMKRPKEDGADVPALERLIGPVAYRGRTQYVERKKGKSARPTGIVNRGPKVVSNLDLTKRGVPMNTIVAEKASQRPAKAKPNVAIGTRVPQQGVAPAPKRAAKSPVNSKRESVLDELNDEVNFS